MVAFRKAGLEKEQEKEKELSYLNWLSQQVTEALQQIIQTAQPEGTQTMYMYAFDQIQVLVEFESSIFV